MQFTKINLNSSIAMLLTKSLAHPTISSSVHLFNWGQYRHSIDNYIIYTLRGTATMLQY